MNLDQPWKIATLIGLLAFLRIVWGLWRSAPSRRFMLELLDSGLIAFILVFLLIRPFVVQAFYIPSESMVPTLMPGDRILVNKFVYRLNEPNRGDIIVFEAPPQALKVGERKDFVKRLIGLPGDTIRIRRDDGVYINGSRLQESRGVPPPDYDWPEDTLGQSGRVPEGRYFVLGDFRTRSNDSHKWGMLETGRVVGKAMVIFWPPGRISLVGDNRDVGLPEAPRVATREGTPAEAAAR